MAYPWHRYGVAATANYNSNNNVHPKPRNLLPSLPKIGTRHASDSGGSSQSVKPQNLNNSPVISRSSDIQSSSLQVSNRSSVGGSYHSGGHDYGQTGVLSGKTSNTTDKQEPPPYQPPDFASLGTGAHSGTSTPRQRRKEGRSSRSRDKPDDKTSGRSRSLSRGRDKSMQESDRQPRDRTRSTYSSETVMGAGKGDRNPRPRSRSQSRDRTPSSGKRVQKSDGQLHDKVRSSHSNETATGAGKNVRNPHPRPRAQSVDRITARSHTSDGGDMRDKTVRSSKLRHHSTMVNSASTDRTQSEGDANGAQISGVNVGEKGKEKQTGKFGRNTPARSWSEQPSTLKQDTSCQDVSGSQLGSAGHQSLHTTMSSVHTNRMQNEGGSSGTQSSVSSLVLGSSHRSNSPSHKTSPEYANVFPKSGGTVGISNLGNTCFMNSMLQCLGQTGEMTEIFLRNPEGKKLVKAYSELMQQMWEKKSSHTSLSYHALYPRTLKDIFSRLNPQFSGYNQHDSQEFMRFLVSGLHEELKKEPHKKPDPPKNENDSGQWWKWYMELEHSALAHVFVGQLRSTLECKSCRHQSLTFDPFWELSVPMQKKAAFRTSSSSSSKYSTRHSTHYSTSYSTSYSSFSTSSVHLEECLDLFTREETLDGDEKPFCTNCRSLQCCSKKMTIERLPKVLVVHLKRFSGYGYRSKLNTPVTIPHTLNLTKYCTDEMKGHTYELYALSHHTGSVYFGHYYAWCKHYSNGKWYSYNDSSVTTNTSSELTTGKEFPSSTAYVLFYRQKDNRVYSTKPRDNPLYKSTAV